MEWSKVLERFNEGSKSAGHRRVNELSTFTTNSEWLSRPEPNSEGLYTVFWPVDDWVAAYRRRNSMPSLNRIPNMLASSLPVMHVSRHQPATLAHHSPVIFVGSSTNHAYLIVTTSGVDARPRKSM
jgi:hypothetical protein